MSPAFGAVVPILRFSDLRATLQFSVDHLSCTVDRQDGDGERPTDVQAIAGRLALRVSNHHDDGTPGTAVLIETRGVEQLRRAVHAAGCSHMLPGVEPHPLGRELTAIDPASNRLSRLRFFERAAR